MKLNEEIPVGSYVEFTVPARGKAPNRLVRYWGNEVIEAQHPDKGWIIVNPKVNPGFVSYILETLLKQWGGLEVFGDS